MKPLVSICCITYNHAPFIRQCLDGFLMQQGVDYEILIHDDCSTDGTTEIIKEYAAKYPDIIKPLYEEENQYQKGNDGIIDFYNYKRARGKYIAYCEGDDYWTDPLKLQKQVDFMEAHPKYTVCFHEFEMHNTFNGAVTRSQYPYEGDFDVTHESFICEPYNVAHPMTMMFRVSCYNYEWQKHYQYFRDTMETYHILREGKGRFMRFNGGVYHIHSGGVSSQMPNYERARLTLPTYIAMYQYTHDGCLRKMIKDTALWALSVCDKEGCPIEKQFVYKLIWCSDKLLYVSIVITLIKRNFKRIIKSV